MDYRGAIDYLYGLQHHGIKLGLDNTVKLLGLLGSPHRSFKSVHIAGTNGKGSTAVMTASLLACSGYKTGLFTSPHLVSFTERIRVNGEEIKEEDVLCLTAEIRGIVEKEFSFSPTFFEFTTAMCFLYFARRGVDRAVIETGMGGRLDATNVIAPEVSVITGIDLDHREFLGNTLREIAGEKAGIIKNGIPVVSASQHPDAMEVIKRKADSAGSPLFICGIDLKSDIIETGAFSVSFDYKSGGHAIEGVSLPLGGAYQASNAALAIKAFELISGECPDNFIRGCLSRGIWSHPGRLELIAPGVLIDGAHNPAAAEALSRAVKEIREKTGAKRIALIVGIMGDKDIEGILKPLLSVSDDVILTAPKYSRAASPESLLKCALSLGFAANTADSVEAAIEAARDKGALVLVTGSFYTIGEAREAVKGRRDGPLRGLR